MILLLVLPTQVTPIILPIVLVTQLSFHRRTNKAILFKSFVVSALLVVLIGTGVVPIQIKLDHSNYLNVV